MIGFSRYEGELSVDAVTDWVATTILGLPRIPYYSKDSLVIQRPFPGSLANLLTISTKDSLQSWMVLATIDFGTIFALR